MNYLTSFFIFLIVISCCSKKNNNNAIENEKQNNISTYTCPDEGNCTLEIIKNKSLFLKTVNNDIIYTIVEDSSKTIVKYNYSIHQEQAVYDGGYAEEIIFEIDSKDYSLTLTDEELKKAKIFYRRFCACRGKTGLVLISKGKLQINNNAGQINLNLNLDSESTPQVTKNIKVINGKL